MKIDGGSFRDPDSRVFIADSRVFRGLSGDAAGDPDRRTLGIRCPEHPVALEFLRASGPLAVTSANISGRPAVLTVEDARNLFGDDVAVYLDGEAIGGSASTIIDLTQPAEWVLRDGPVTP